MNMAMPSGKTCQDCHHLRWCQQFFGCPPSNTTCDWSPSRFMEAMVEERKQGDSDGTKSPQHG